MTQPTRRQLMTGSLAAVGAAGAPAMAMTADDPHARIEELAAELVDCLRQIAAPDAVRIQFLLNARGERWSMGADEHFMQREPEPRVKGGYIDVEQSRPIVRDGCWR